MAQFDANINLRVVATEAEKKLKQFEKKLQSLEKRTLSRAKKNEGLASNLITGGKAAGQNVGVRLQRQQAKAAQDALRVADARVEKELRLAAAMQRQETILKALNRAGGAQSKAAQERVTDALAASKEAKNNLGIQNAVNTLLEKELQIRREINRVRFAGDEAKRVGRARGPQIDDLAARGGQADKIAEVRRLNAAYVLAAEKGETDIAKAIDRRFKRKFELLKRDVAATEAAAKSEERSYAKADRVIRRLRVKRLQEQKRAAKQFQEDLLLGAGFPLLFGGGAGAVLGGIGGSLAGRGKGGFGAQIFGSAIGQVFDGLVESGLELAKALNKPLENIDSLLDALPRLDAPTKVLIADLRAAGLEASAAAIVVDQFNERLKTLGVTDVDKFKRDTKEFQNAVKDLEVAAGILASSKFIGVINLIKDGFLILSKLEPSGPLQRAAGGALAQRDLQRGRNSTGATESTPASQRQLDIAQQFKDLENQTNAIQQQREELIRRSVTMSAEQVALSKADLVAQEATNKVKRLELELENAKGTTKEANLKRSLAEAEVAERTAKATRDQVAALAALAQQQAARSVRRAQIGTNDTLLRLQIQEAQLTKGKIDALKIERVLRQQALQDKIELIELERQQLLETNKGRGLDEEINKLAERKILLAQEAVRLADEELKRKQALLELERQLAVPRAVGELEDRSRLAGQSLEEARIRARGGAGEKALDDAREILQIQERLAALNGKATLDEAIAEKNRLKALEDARAFEEVMINLTNQVGVALKNAMETALVDTIGAALTGADDLNDKLKQTAATLLSTIGKALVGAGIQGLAGNDGQGFFSILAGNFGRADGGPVNSNQAYVVGEREPELFVPSSSGTIYNQEQMRSAMSTYSYGSESRTFAEPMSINVETTSINGMEFITPEQFKKGTEDAAARGAKMGEQRAINRLRQSRSTRSKLGI